MRRIFSVIFLGAILSAATLFALGCAVPRSAGVEEVTVEGNVSARGNAPFSEYVLETADHRLYVLEIPSGSSGEFEGPSRFRVTGRLYVDDWDSRPFAHIEVYAWEQLP